MGVDPLNSEPEEKKETTNKPHKAAEYLSPTYVGEKIKDPVVWVAGKHQTEGYVCDCGQRKGNDKVSGAKRGEEAVYRCKKETQIRPLNLTGD